jgi:thymidylate synthase
MWVNNAVSVSQALSQGLHALRVRGITQPSRVGDVLVSPHPVLTVYSNPRNRVLFSSLRDANPFFHVMESLWMLAGRNDLPWLAEFNKRMATYSDDGGRTQPGAYGHRWRHYFGFDQLETLIVELKHNPQTRRAVLAMWDGGHENDRSGPELDSDLLNGIAGSADVPCNTHAYFDTIDGKLNMTVCCRSNDIWWGAHGANAVHFSFLLEYVAAMTDLSMGVYRQFSNNYHAYTNVIPESQLMPVARDVKASDRYFGHDGPFLSPLPVTLTQVNLVTPDSPTTFLEDLNWFMDDVGGNYGHLFFSTVAEPMRRAWRAHKAKDYPEAIHQAEQIRAEDWRIACVEWLRRRQITHNLNAQPFTEVTDGNA